MSFGRHKKRLLDLIKKYKNTKCKETGEGITIQNDAALSSSEDQQKEEEFGPE